MGNIHPRFWGWYMGNGTMIGALADFLASTMNPNLGGGNHVANLVERQVVDWCKQIIGYPVTASGLMVSGASMANFGTTLPVYDGSKWDWINCRELYLDDKGVEQWKTAFYRVEGWDAKTGYPKRKTLEGLGMKHVADVLGSRDKLGSA